MINEKDFSPEQLALYEACNAIPPNLPEIRKLLEAGVSPDIKYKADKYPSEQNLLQDVIENYSFFIKLYEIVDNISLNKYYKFYPELVELLCSHGADPNYTHDSDYCLCQMQYAPDNEYSAEIVKTLLKYGADPNNVGGVGENLYEDVWIDIFYERDINNNDLDTWQPKFLQLLVAHGGHPQRPTFTGARLLPGVDIDFSDLADLSRFSPRFEKSDEGGEFFFIYDVETGKNVVKL